MSRRRAKQIPGAEHARTTAAAWRGMRDADKQMAQALGTVATVAEFIRWAEAHELAPPVLTPPHPARPRDIIEAALGHALSSPGMHYLVTGPVLQAYTHLDDYAVEQLTDMHADDPTRWVGEDTTDEVCFTAQDHVVHLRLGSALVQTPIYVADFILDRTMTPAVEEFAPDIINLIDPSCGMGIFLTLAYRRMRTHYPHATGEELLAHIDGVDLDLMLVGVARWRLAVEVRLETGHWPARAPRIKWQNALLDADDPLQPYVAMAGVEPAASGSDARRPTDRAAPPRPPLDPSVRIGGEG